MGYQTVLMLAKKAMQYMYVLLNRIKLRAQNA